MANKYATINFLCKGNGFECFWKEYLNKGDKKIKYILGLGFDPRTLHCFKLIDKYVETNTIDYKIIEYDDPFSSINKLENLLQKNKKLLKEIVINRNFTSTTIHMLPNNENDLSVDASKSISQSDLDQYTDIILDVSAMPIGVYFPIVRNILDWIKKRKITSPTGHIINFHLVVSENSNFDKRIKEIRTNDKVTYMYKFASKLHLESAKTLRKVWIPLLGENQKTQLAKIYAEIEPKEICPIFPMPSYDPYRSKNLLIDYRELLFDTFVIEPRNYIYTNENNPFETCKKIYDTAHSYYDSFKPLKGCQIIISPLSSKLLCIGALLATYELYTEGSNAGIIHVETQTYDVDEEIDTEKILKTSIPYSMWLAGDCYDD